MYNISEIKERSGLDIISTRNLNTKDDFINILCKDHGNYYLSLQDIEDGHLGCPRCEFNVNVFLNSIKNTKYYTKMYAQINGLEVIIVKDFICADDMTILETENDILNLWFNDKTIKEFNIFINKISEEPFSFNLIQYLDIKIKEKIWPVFWSDRIQQLKSRHIPVVRNLMQEENNNLCTICKNPLSKPTLDHAHISKVRGTGYVRDVCCSMCNTFIARSENNAPRHGIAKKDLPNILRNIADHLEKETNMIHPSEEEKRKKVQKREWNKVNKYYFKVFPNRRTPPQKPKYVSDSWLELKNKVDEYVSKL